MRTPTVDFEGLLGAVEGAVGDVTSLIRSVEDPDAIAVGRWSVAETAAHLSHAFERHANGLESRSFPRIDAAAIAQHNAETLQSDPERDRAVLAERIDDAASRVVARARTRGPSEVVTWYGGIDVTVATLAAVALAEALVHGFDIARADGKPWAIDPAHARFVFDGVMALAPHYVDADAAAGVKASYDVRVRGGSRVFLVFDHGALHVEEPSSRAVDCHISADPVAFLLVSYGRLGVWGPTLRGHLFSWGRKPWLAVRLTRLLKNP